MILLDAKMVSMDLIAPSFSSLAKSREVKERHGSWIKLAGYIGKIDIHMLSRACGSYQDFLDRGLLLARKLLNQVFLLVKLKSSLRKFYGRHHDLVDRYGISVSQMNTDMFHLS